MSQLDQQILDIYRELRRQSKVSKYLAKLEKKMTALANDIEVKHKELDQIEDRLEWLDSAPLRLLKAFISKTQEKEHNRWKEGYFDRVMEYKALIKEKELCQFEYDILKAQLVNVPDKKANLKKLIDEKAIEVLMEKGPANEALRDLYEEIAFKYALVEEIREAYFHGEKALHAINGLLNSLNVAQQNQGNARLSSQTHLLFYLQSAQAEVDETYRCLQRYVLELNDISSEEPVKGYDDLITAENFIGDLYKALLNYASQAFVQKATNRVAKIKHRLLKSNEQLQKELGYTERSIKRLRRKRELFLIRDSRLDQKKDG
ncbi:MAG: hypothetical protein Sapg2KO_17720 [Saprospiraceae bacterium]